MPLADILARQEESKRILTGLSMGDAIYIGGTRYRFVSYDPNRQFGVTLEVMGRYSVLKQVMPTWLANVVDYRIVPVARQRKFTPRKRNQYAFVATDAGRYLSERNDCTVRALSIAVGVDYVTAHEFMKAHGRKDGHGAMLFVYRAWAHNEYRIRSFWEVAGIPWNDPRRERTLGQWLKSGELPERAIVGTRGHVFAVINGTVYDTGRTGARSKVNIVYEVSKL